MLTRTLHAWLAGRAVSCLGEPQAEAALPGVWALGSGRATSGQEGKETPDFSPLLWRQPDRPRPLQRETSGNENPVPCSAPIPGMK